MKYNDNGEYKEIVVKSTDTLPVGTEVDFDGNEVPSGWTEKSINKINMDLTTGSPYSTYGGCYYYKIGNKVHIHIGISGLTANTQATIFTMPTSYRPSVYVSGVGIGNTLSNTSSVFVQPTGLITILSTGQYALIDMDYEVDNGKIQKTSQYIEGGASLSNVYGTSNENGYTQEYINGLETYSTTEKRIGTWIDGKPLYRKVISTGALPNNSSKGIQHNISNIGIVKEVSGYVTDGSAFRFINSPSANSSIGPIEGFADTTYIYLRDSANLSTFSGYAIIEYTKTTDTTQQTRSISNDEVEEEDNR